VTVPNPAPHVDHALIQSTIAILAFLFAVFAAFAVFPESSTRLLLITGWNVVVVIVINFLLWRAISPREVSIRYIFRVNIIVVPIILIIADVGISDAFPQDRESALRLIMGSNLVVLCFAFYLYNFLNNRNHREHSEGLSGQLADVQRKHDALDADIKKLDNDLVTTNRNRQSLDQQMKDAQGVFDHDRANLDAKIRKLHDDLVGLQQQYDAEVAKQATASGNLINFAATQNEINALRGMLKRYGSFENNLRRFDANIKHLLSDIYLKKSLPTPDKIFDFMFEFIMESVLDLPTDHKYQLSVTRLLPDGRFQVLAQRNIGEEARREIEENFRGNNPPYGLAGRCAQEKRPLVCPDIDNCQGWVPIGNPQSIGSIICIPILNDRLPDKECFGVLSIACISKNALQQVHVDQIVEMASEKLKHLMLLLVLEEDIHTLRQTLEDLLRWLLEGVSFNEDQLQQMRRRAGLN